MREKEETPGDPATEATVEQLRDALRRARLEAVREEGGRWSIRPSPKKGYAFPGGSNKQSGWKLLFWLTLTIAALVVLLAVEAARAQW